MTMGGRLRRWLREPLLHFLIIGAGLFVLFDLVGEDREPPRNRIVVTGTDVERLATLFERQWQRPPTSTELDSLIDAHVREEILYREALALGLDRDDSIVRRRMAQKLEFLFEDVTAPAQPDDAALQSYLDENAERFTEPPRVRFSHVYLNRDKRGAAARDDAERLLAQLRGGATLPTQELGDRFMLEYRYDADQDQIARLFGREFAARLVALPARSWQGPVESGYGLHLVYVDENTPARLPALAEVRDAVQRDLVADRRRDANEAFYDNLRGRYEIIVEDRPAAPMSTASTEN